MIAAVAAVARRRTAVQAADISGAGATFPYPVYAKWADAYKKETGIGLNYQSIGSGGGIKQIKAKTVTFGASDMPLKPEDLEAAGLVQFPMIIGGVVPVVNVPGVAPASSRSTGRRSPSMYMGEITKWNDPKIAKLNPKLKLPDAGDRAYLPFGRLGHELPVHRLSLEGEPEVQGLDRCRTLRCSGRSASAPRAMKASRT